MLLTVPKVRCFGGSGCGFSIRSEPGLTVAPTDRLKDLLELSFEMAAADSPGSDFFFTVAAETSAGMRLSNPMALNVAIKVANRRMGFTP
jgi:hypothetical protein